ncbi:OB-fold domain-containing protein [Pollutimonas sp. H1-120]|uniref:Zn-ribbon domain-containing OB-fold protein n=1 Tax=Pollutimonas sp. H1-120 TaxID=3148824 RepID=UPI003B526A47
MSIPEIAENTVSAPYWQALREGRLDFQHCGNCGNSWLPPRNHCPSCLASDVSWLTATGKGRLQSWVVYHKAYAPQLNDRIPYNVAIVELVEGPRLLTNIIGCPDGKGLSPNAKVQLCIEEDFGRCLPRFRLKNAKARSAPR